MVMVYCKQIIAESNLAVQPIYVDFVDCNLAWLDSDVKLV